MITTNQPRTVILAATDGSSVSEEAVGTAAQIAANAPGGELHLIHVLQPNPGAMGRNVLLPTLTELLASARTLLEEATAQARGRCPNRIESHFRVGDPWREIVQLGADLSADLIVVGSHQRKGVERFLLGSVSEQVVRKAPCQVLVSRPKSCEAIPEIEPPCAECTATQARTSGTKLWCAQHEHREQHARARLHYETPPTFAVGSSLLRPEQ